MMVGYSVDDDELLAYIEQESGKVTIAMKLDYSMS